MAGGRRSKFDARFLTTLAIASGLTLSLGAATVVPGGGKAASDCYVTLAVDGGAPTGTTTVTCVDGDPSCDHDGACGNDACRFSGQLCVDQAGVPGCTPPAGLDVVTLKNDLFPVPASLAGAQCGAAAEQTVAVRTHRGHKKPGRLVVKALGRAPRGTRPAVDHDRFVLICAPRLDVCPSTTTTTTTTLPLDMYVMLDQTGSMSDPVTGGGSKFGAVSSALTTFMQQASAAGVGLGIQYFGLPGGLACGTICTIDTDCGPPACGPCFSNVCLGAAPDSCTASDYATPDVEIAPLPGVAAAIGPSLQAHGPSTGASTSAALQGAVDHAKAWAMTHAGHRVVTVLVTDGDPGECDVVLGDVTAIAMQGAAGTPSVLTYVVAIGTSLTSPDPIAAAGGTTQAFVVDPGLAVSQQVLAAFDAIVAH